MSCSRSIKLSPYQGSCSPPILGRSLSTIFLDINSNADQDKRRYPTSLRAVYLNDELTLSPSLSPKFRILNKKSGSCSQSPRFLKLENSRLLADESLRKSRKLQNHLSLQVLDGEGTKFKHNAQTPQNRTALDVILNVEKAKRKPFRFPEAGMFKREDEKFEEITEDEYEKQDLKHDLKQLPCMPSPSDVKVN